MIRVLQVGLMLMAALVVLAACRTAATEPATPTPEIALLEETPATPTFGVGEITDLDGMQAGSWNADAYAGIQAAIAEFGIAGQYLVSQQPSDYAKHIQEFVKQDLDLIVIVGPVPDGDPGFAPQAYPDHRFAIVESAFPDCSPVDNEAAACNPDPALPNIRHLAFQMDEAAFLAGYLAAGMTETGKVGTYGATRVPSVTALMRAYEAGVNHYNTIHAANVEVKGGLSEPAGGLFTGNFDSIEDGSAYAHSLLLAGADVILPATGKAGLGSAAVCEETRLCLIIGVNTDWFVSAPEYRAVELTSILKKVDVAVYDTIRDALEGSFTGGTVVYTIKDGGVDLAPFHDLDERIPLSLKSELEQLRAQLGDGSLKIDELRDVEQ